MRGQARSLPRQMVASVVASPPEFKPSPDASDMKFAAGLGHQPLALAVWHSDAAAAGALDELFAALVNPDR